MNVKVKKIHISNVEGNNKAHISTLFDMYGKYLRIYDKVKDKSGIRLKPRENLIALTKLSTVSK